MRRQAINRILLVVFAIALLLMGSLYVRQEHKMTQLQQEQEALIEKQEKIRHLISEYNLLLDSVDSRNYIVRIAREKLGWVFDDETIYKRPYADPTKPTPSPTPPQTLEPTESPSPEPTESATPSPEGTPDIIPEETPQP